MSTYQNCSEQSYKCPTCSAKFSGKEFFPFCSARCKTIDLGNWAMEKYVVQGKEIGLDEELTEIPVDGDPTE